MRERSSSGFSIERKSSFTTILTIKIVVIGINEFRLVMGVLPGYFFLLIA